jgi:hypothetical protein
MIAECGEPFVSAAVHEAGHAVAAIALGEKVIFATAWVVNGVQGGTCRHTVERPEVGGVIAYAGAISQRLFAFPVASPSTDPNNPYTLDGASGDEKHAFDFAERFSFSEASERRVLRVVFAQAYKLTSHHCEAISRVALAILDHGYVEGEAVHRLFKPR